MNLMPLTRKGGCKVTNFSRDQYTSTEQFIKILSFINNNHWVLGDRCIEADTLIRNFQILVKIKTTRKVYLFN